MKWKLNAGSRFYFLNSPSHNLSPQSHEECQTSLQLMSISEVQTLTKYYWMCKLLPQNSSKMLNLSYQRVYNKDNDYLITKNIDQ